VALLERAARQGHAHAMPWLGNMHHKRKEYGQATEWFMRGAKAGLPDSMIGPGRCCSPSYPTDFVTSFIDFNGIL